MAEETETAEERKARLRELRAVRPLTYDMLVQRGRVRQDEERE